MIELFGVVVFGLVVYAVVRALQWSADHHGWEDGSAPDPEAKIVDVKSEKVKYSKNNAKYKTTVKFSDGFYYITHKTNREEHVGGKYKIYMDSLLEEEITESAKAAHDRAIQARGGQSKG